MAVWQFYKTVLMAIFDICVEYLVVCLICVIFPIC